MMLVHITLKNATLKAPLIPLLKMADPSTRCRAFGFCIVSGARLIRFGFGLMVWDVRIRKIDPSNSQNRLLIESSRDITINIRQGLDTIDIVTSASLVSPKWRNICKYPQVWHTISMTGSSSHWNDSDLVKICFNVTEQSRDHLEENDIERFSNNDLLICIAEKASNLRCMRLLNNWGISEIVFAESVRKLPKLEEVDISIFYFSKLSLGIIGLSTFVRVEHLCKQVLEEKKGK
ncbi:putative F-box/LRR-repeat protein 9 [Vicia villosa]|uniref:putative F-box/LRR-repeat protein 9 n=1 Tax=Vicia villosa TaxID=3911 RepID=UPI00273B2FE5|nr:putative F-box/LRR-repeat protein 9 [Vicia villosa]